MLCGLLFYHRRRGYGENRKESRGKGEVVACFRNVRSADLRVRIADVIYDVFFVKTGPVVILRRFRFYRNAVSAFVVEINGDPVFAVRNFKILGTAFDRAFRRFILGYVIVDIDYEKFVGKSAAESEPCLRIGFQYQTSSGIFAY